MDYKNKFDLKIVDYGYMRRSGTSIYMRGTMMYHPPSLFKELETKQELSVRKERDIYGLLISIFCIEFGEEYLTKYFTDNHKCFTELYSEECFNKLLEMIYYTIIDNDTDFIGLGIRVVETYFSKEKPYMIFQDKTVFDDDCNDILCFLLSNIKLIYDDFKNDTQIANQLGQLINIEKKKERKFII